MLIGIVKPSAANRGLIPGKEETEMKYFVFVDGERVAEFLNKDEAKRYAKSLSKRRVSDVVVKTKAGRIVYADR